MDTVIAFAARSLKLPTSELTAIKLFGQASARQYFRVTDKNQKSTVVMLLPDGFASKAEEVTKIDADFELKDLAFLNVQEYLYDLSVRVPAVLAVDRDGGMILLQDLGDKMLENCIQDATPEFKLFYYRQAIDTLLDLQAKTAAHPDPKCVAYHRRFSVELLKWEIDHFREYGIEDRFGIKLPATVSADCDRYAKEICERIAKMPQGFVHRDFQSRNLMFADYHFWLIDFQDALLGPVLYDLVALLRDSYVAFTPEETEILLDYYFAQLPATHPYADKSDQLRQDFHLITLQRKLKDTGRFQFIATVKKNPGFLPHVPQSLAYVKAAFAALPEWRPLQNLLAEHVAELR